MTDILNELSALAAAIHYPECWDTAAYPDLLSALREVTASAGCSMCKPQVEQDPVGEGTDDRAIADTVNTLRDIAINFHAADQLRARIAHVVVPRLKRIKNLKARAHDHLALLGAERNRALKAEQERDALRSQLDRVTWALEHLLERGIAPPDRNCSCHISPPCNDCVEWSGLREAVEHAESALAAVKGEKP